MVRKVKVFVSYSHKDESLKLALDEHLSPLKQSDTIAYWHDRNIGAGTEWAKEIDDNLNSADIILLLISSSFINSRYCWTIELKRAIERHEAGTACVIPIIVRPAFWQNTPISKLQAFPKDALAITSWRNRDEAFVDVVMGIQAAVERLAQQSDEALPTPEEIQAETEEIAQKIVESGQGEAQYREEVLFCLKQDCGEISPESRILLEVLRDLLKLSHDRAIAIETKIALPFQEFRKVAIGLVQTSGSISSRGQALLDRIQKTLGLESEDATAIVENVLTSIQSPEPSLPIFRFDVITVNDQGQEIDRRSGQATYFREELAKDVFLDMISIPGGTFWMGAAQEELEARDNEQPRHQVAIKPFFMGKFAVTQEQWKAIAELEKIDCVLKPEPSRFRGENLPVERVSWHEAVEFCKRLSRKTGKNYLLPTEAIWEYACRARTQTPFYFGETINTAIANFNGNSVYNNGLKGQNRKRTTKADCFPPNDFGLFDLHGNVWEWCLDHWHDNYVNAPTDGSAQNASEKEQHRSLRGGSWYSDAKFCRSASRNKFSAVERRYHIGFRVVCYI